MNIEHQIEHIDHTAISNAEGSFNSITDSMWCDISSQQIPIRYSKPHSKDNTLYKIKINGAILP